MAAFGDGRVPLGRLELIAGRYTLIPDEG